DGDQETAREGAPHHVAERVAVLASRATAHEVADGFPADRQVHGLLSRRTMHEPIYAYVIAISMLLVCGVCALAMFRTIDHFDPPEVREVPEERHQAAAV